MKISDNCAGNLQKISSKSLERKKGFKYTAQKMQFSNKDFLSKSNQIRRFLGILSHLLKKSLMGKLIF